MATFTKRYSRGNNDPTEDQYETAAIDIALEVDTSGCKESPEGCLGWLFRYLHKEGMKGYRHEEGRQGDGGSCTGEVAIKLKYQATMSTADPDAITIGQNYALSDGGQGGNSAQLTHTAAPPGGPEGDKLTAEIDLASIPCTGGRLRGTVGVELRPAGGPFTGFVIERITYDIEISRCGVITQSVISAQELTPDASRVPTPLRDITPPPGGGAPPETPYPQYPGVPRTP